MKKMIFWWFIVLLLTGLACSLPFGSGGNTVPAGGLPDPAAETFPMAVSDKALLEPVHLSGAQRQVLAVRGIPNRFLILFSDGMREETWYYDAVGFAITFRNGETYTENQGDPVPAEYVLKSDYTPWLFNSKMGLSELLAVSGSDFFAHEPLDEAFDEDISLVTLPGLDAGFRGERLLYIRSVPMSGFQSIGVGEDPATVEPQTGEQGLTAAEQSHSGTHVYEVYCTYSDGTSEEYEDSITWIFADDGVYFAGEGPFPKVNVNVYGISDEDAELFIHYQEKVVTITGESIDIDADGENVLVSFACVLTQE